MTTTATSSRDLGTPGIVLTIDQRQRLHQALKYAGLIIAGHDDQVEACQELLELGLIQPNPTNYGVGTQAYLVTAKGASVVRGSR